MPYYLRTKGIAVLNMYVDQIVRVLLRQKAVDASTSRSM